VVALGIDATIEGEAHDRTSIGLPGKQRDFLNHILASVDPKKVILVLVNGGPLAIDDIPHHVPTILDVMDDGQYAGDAFAHVVYGKTNPSAMLPYTLYPSIFTSQVNMSDMNMRAGPGRTYRFYRDTPTFPFGYGLSYSTFSLAWADNGSLAPRNLTVKTSDALPKAASSHGASLAWTVTVAMNNGDPDGSIPLQSYVSRLDTTDGPLRSLFDLQKVAVTTNRSATVHVDARAPHGLTHTPWCVFCTTRSDGSRAIVAGSYRLAIGGHGGPEETQPQRRLLINIDLVGPDVPFPSH